MTNSEILLKWGLDPRNVLVYSLATEGLHKKDAKVLQVAYSYAGANVKNVYLQGHADLNSEHTGIKQEAYTAQALPLERAIEKVLADIAAFNPPLVINNARRWNESVIACNPGMNGIWTVLYKYPIVHLIDVLDVYGAGCRLGVVPGKGPLKETLAEYARLKSGIPLCNKKNLMEHYRTVLGREFPQSSYRTKAEMNIRGMQDLWEKFLTMEG